MWGDVTIREKFRLLDESIKDTQKDDDEGRVHKDL